MLNTDKSIKAAVLNQPLEQGYKGKLTFYVAHKKRVTRLRGLHFKCLTRTELQMQIRVVYSLETVPLYRPLRLLSSRPTHWLGKTS